MYNNIIMLAYFLAGDNYLCWCIRTLSCMCCLTTCPPHTYQPGLLWLAITTKGTFGDQLTGRGNYGSNFYTWLFWLLQTQKCPPCIQTGPSMYTLILYTNKQFKVIHSPQQWIDYSRVPLFHVPFEQLNSGLYTASQFNWGHVIIIA